MAPACVCLSVCFVRSIENRGGTVLRETMISFVVIVTGIRFLPFVTMLCVL